MAKKSKKNNRSSSKSLALENIDIEASQGIFGQRSVFQMILIGFIILIVFLPFITTFNEVLTKIIERFHLYAFIEDLIVPTLSRIVAVVLIPFDIDVIGTQTGMYLPEKSMNIQIAWNCVGWQSLILIAITLITGLQGRFTRFSKAQSILIGLLGTFLINVIRISSVVLFAVYFGHYPAVIYHDYFSNILIILWLFFFWWFSYAMVLEIAPYSGLIEKRAKKQEKKKKFNLNLSLKDKKIKHISKINNQKKKKK